MLNKEVMMNPRPEYPNQDSKIEFPPEKPHLPEKGVNRQELPPPKLEGTLSQEPQTPQNIPPLKETTPINPIEQGAPVDEHIKNQIENSDERSATVEKIMEQYPDTTSKAKEMMDQVTASQQ